MREIKFRALPINSKQFEYGDLFYHEGVPGIFKSGKCSLVCQVGTEGQFTGLKDKNGVDIYEGDIVATPYIDPKNKLHADTENRRGKIIFSHGCFLIDLYPFPHPLRDWCNSHQSEYIPNFGHYPIMEETNVVWVLGNIYQNPELL